MAERDGTAQDFLDLYKRLEDALEARYRGQKRKYSGVVLEFVRGEESAPFREGLEACREVRNLLTHTANVDGQPVVSPAPGLFRVLERALDYVSRPPLALDCATRAGNILKANMNHRALSRLQTMEKRGFSHVPVFSGQVLVGVFSTECVARWVLHSGRPLDAAVTLKAFKPYLSAHRGGHYGLADRNLTRQEARRRFEEMQGKNQRLAVLFITEHGRPTEPLLGMLTPWDLIL